MLMEIYWSVEEAYIVYDEHCELFEDDQEIIKFSEIRIINKYNS